MKKSEEDRHKITRAYFPFEHSVISHWKRHLSKYRKHYPLKQLQINNKSPVVFHCDYSNGFRSRRRLATQPLIRLPDLSGLAEAANGPVVISTVQHAVMI